MLKGILTTPEIGGSLVNCHAPGKSELLNDAAAGPDWQDAVIVGFARKDKTREEFHDIVSEALENSHVCKEMPELRDSIPGFLERVHYFKGSYDSDESMAELDSFLKEEEGKLREGPTLRLFYMAIPPFVFPGAAQAIRNKAMSDNTRLIVEKPFGHDLSSATELQEKLGALFEEEAIYRMDHFLGYEINQSILAVRFGNVFLEPLMNRHHVASVRITLKEDFDLQGRGGYFTKYGVIRDNVQNHLLQMLCLVAMEKPSTSGACADLRDAKLEVLKAMEVPDTKDMVLGQYEGADGEPGYLEDESIPEEDRESAKRTATFVQLVVRINNERWKGVNFIVKAGKAVDESKCEIRVQFKEPAATCVLKDVVPRRDELVMRVSPHQAVYMRMNVKSPGLSTDLVQSEMDLTYCRKYPDVYTPSAYTRLILAAIQGDSQSFVRDDEMLRAWELFTPLLDRIEAEKLQPTLYPRGSRGPPEADAAWLLGFQCFLFLFFCFSCCFFLFFFSVEWLDGRVAFRSSSMTVWQLGVQRAQEMLSQYGYVRPQGKCSRPDRPNCAHSRLMSK